MHQVLKTYEPYYEISHCEDVDLMYTVMSDNLNYTSTFYLIISKSNSLEQLNLSPVIIPIRL